MKLIPVKLKYVGAHHDKPTYATTDSSGCDLVWDGGASEPITLLPGERFLFGTGLAVAIPSGFEGQVRPKSGNAWKKGLTVLNNPGTVDADYRGQIMVNLVNLGQVPVVIKAYDKIAQLVICPVYQAFFQEVEDLDETTRGAGGHGSTGGGVK